MKERGMHLLVNYLAILLAPETANNRNMLLLMWKCSSGKHFRP
jgi:hypothetical protein